MKAISRNFLFLLALAGFGLLSVGTNSIFAQTRASFKVSGPCMACGEDRILEIVKQIDGVKSVSFDKATSLCKVEYDQVSASLIDIQLELSMQGYDAGDFTRDSKAKLPVCAKTEGAIAMRGEEMRPLTLNDDLPEPGIDDLEDSDKDTDWENPKAFELIGNSTDDFDDIDLLDEEIEDPNDLLEWGQDAPIGDFGDVDLDDEEENDDDE